MKTLHFEQAALLSKLHDELIAGIPALAPVPFDDPLLPGALRPVIQVIGTDQEVWLTVPDDADDAAITAIVEAHDPTPSPPPPTQQQLLAERLAAGQTALAGATTLAQVKSIMGETLADLAQVLS